MIADDYIDDDDLDDADDMPLDLARVGGLVVPECWPNERCREILSRGFVASYPVMFISFDEQTGEAILDNRTELVAEFGLNGTVAEIEALTAPDLAPPDPALVAELIAAMQDEPP